MIRVQVQTETLMAPVMGRDMECLVSGIFAWSNFDKLDLQFHATRRYEFNKAFVQDYL